VYDTDLSDKAHLKFLYKRSDEDFKVFSKVDSKDCSLFKLATALKIMFDPHGRHKVGNHYKVNLNFFCKSYIYVCWKVVILAVCVFQMFSHDELTSITRDAHLYQQTLDKDLVLRVYDDAVTLLEGKAELLYELRSLVQEAKEALETEAVQEKSAASGVDSKKHVDAHV
jgi:hypothetical protein